MTWHVTTVLVAHLASWPTREISWRSIILYGIFGGIAEQTELWEWVHE